MVWGSERTIDISKGGSYFAHCGYITKELDKLFLKLGKENNLSSLDQEIFCDRLSYYFNEINAAHPFREGNGRTQRAFCKLLAEKAGYKIDWTLVNQQEYIEASKAGFVYGDYKSMKSILQQIISPNSRNRHVNNINISEEFIKTKEASMLGINNTEKAKGGSNQIVPEKLDLNVATELSKYSELEDKMLCLIDKEINFRDLVRLKNSNLVDDPKKAKEYGQQAILVGKEIDNFSKDILSSPDIKNQLDDVEKKEGRHNFASLSSCGGYESIKKRIEAKQVTGEDITVMYRKMKSRVESLSRTLSQEQDRDISR